MATTKWWLACPSRSTCWSRKSARWRSTWSWKNGEAGNGESGIGNGQGKSRVLADDFRLLDSPLLTIPDSQFPIPGDSHERPAQPLQPAAPVARFRLDQDRARVPGPDPVVVVRRGQEAG